MSGAGVRWEAFTIAVQLIAVASRAVMIPFNQSRFDDLKCTQLCFGFLTSARSALQLVGSPALGRVSDAYGRRVAFVVACLGNVLSLTMMAMTDSIMGFGLSIVPAALLSDTFSIAKAVVADCMPTASTQERSGPLGRLGAATGVGLALGPVLAGTRLLETYTQACLAGIALNGAALAVVTAGDWPVARAEEQPEEGVWSLRSHAAHLFRMVGDASPAMRLLLLLRFGMTLAFHVFNVVLMPSLKSKFGLGPKEMGLLMGGVGIFYTGSQLVVAPAAISFVQRRGEVAQKRLVLVCVAVMAAGRAAAYLSHNMHTAGSAMVLVIMALGTLNTFISARVSLLAADDALGATFGLFEAAEKVAGISGPLLGGVLAHVQPDTGPVIFVLLGYVALLVVIGHRWVDAMEASSQGKEKAL